MSTVDFKSNGPNLLQRPTVTAKKSKFIDWLIIRSLLQAQPSQSKI